MTATSALARPMLAGMFVYGGIDSLRNPKSKVIPADKVAPAIARQLGLPEDTELLVRINGGAQVAAGLMLAAGKFPRASSAVLAATLAPTTLAGHRFWEEEDPTKRRAQTVQFLKNMAMFGGLLLSAADTGGRPSVTWAAKRRLRRATRRAARKSAKGAGAAAAASEVAHAMTKLSKTAARTGANAAATASASGAHLARSAAGAVPDLAHAAGATVSQLGDKVGPTVSELGDKVGPTLSALGEKVAPTVSALGERVGPTVTAWGEKVGPTVSALGERVGPTVSALGERVSGHDLGATLATLRR